MPERDFDAEFAQIIRPIEAEQSEESKRDEWRIYAMEDEQFRAAIVRRIAELTGTKTGREFFDD